MSLINGNGDLESRVKKGIQVTREAVKQKDAARLGQCVKQFLVLNIPRERIYEAIEQCPLSLLESAGLCVKMKRTITGTEIVLGKDIGWEEVAALSEVRTNGDELETVISNKKSVGVGISSEEFIGG